MTIKAIKERYQNYHVRSGEHNSFVTADFIGIGRCVIVVNICKHRYVGDYVMQVVRVSDGCALLEDGACRPCDNLTDAVDVASEMLPGRFVVRCYTRIGDLDHEVETDSLIEAEVIRMTWAAKTWERDFGLIPFAYMPTIWAVNDRGKRYRLLGF